MQSNSGLFSFILPDFPANTKWLTPEERQYAVQRLEVAPTSAEAPSAWKSFKQATADWR